MNRLRSLDVTKVQDRPEFYGRVCFYCKSKVNSDVLTQFYSLSFHKGSIKMKQSISKVIFFVTIRAIINKQHKKVADVSEKTTVKCKYFSLHTKFC